MFNSLVRDLPGAVERFVVGNRWSLSGGGHDWLGGEEAGASRATERAGLRGWACRHLQGLLAGGDRGGLIGWWVGWQGSGLGTGTGMWGGVLVHWGRED